MCLTSAGEPEAQEGVRSETRCASGFLESTVSKRRAILVENKWTHARTQDPRLFFSCSGPEWSVQVRPGPLSWAWGSGRAHLFSVSVFSPFLLLTTLGALGLI